MRRVWLVLFLILVIIVGGLYLLPARINPLSQLGLVTQLATSYSDDFADATGIATQNNVTVTGGEVRPVAATGGGGGAVSPSATVIGLWHFDGNRTDSSASNLTTTAIGTVGFTAGKFDQAANFTANNYFSIGNKSLLTGKDKFSISAWVKLNVDGSGSPVGYGPIIGQSGGPGTNAFDLLLRPGGAFFLAGVSTANGNATADSPTLTNPGAWHHVALVYDGAQLTLYLDGVAGTPVALSGGLVASTDELSIGASAAGSFPGAIDDLAIWNKALSSSEVVALVGSAGGASSGSIVSNNVTLGGEISSLTTTWTGTSASQITVEVSGNNGANWCAVTNGQAKTSFSGCGLAGASTLKYRATLPAGTALSNIAFSWILGTPPVDPPPPDPGDPATLYVDGSLADCTTYNPSARTCGSGAARSYRTIQAAVNQATAPGSIVRIRAGRYVEGVTISSRGTASQPIKIQGYNNERPVITGPASIDEFDRNGDGVVDPWSGPGPAPSYPYALVHVTSNARYIELSNLELTDNGVYGLIIDASNSSFRNLRVYKIIRDAIIVGGDIASNVESDWAQNNVISENEIHHSFHGGGILLYRAYNNVIENNLVYENGRYMDGRKVFSIQGDPQGGGNSDGIGEQWACADRTTDPITGRCPKNFYKGNVVFGTADDGFDLFAYQTTLIENISFNVGPNSNLNYKLYGVGESPAVFIRNIGANVNVVGTQAVYAKSIGGMGLTQRGANFINNGAYGVVNDGFRMDVYSGDDFQNNLAINNGRNFFINCNSCSAAGNFSDDNYGVEVNAILNTAPQIYDETPTIDVGFTSTMQPIDRLNHIKDQFRAAFTPKPGSPLIDAGVPASYTDPRTGQKVAISYKGNAPDIGPFESDGSAPVNNFYLNISTVGDGTVSRSAPGPSYPAGTVVTLTAVPAGGAQFTGWSGSASGNTNPLTVTMNGSKTITANFSSVSVPTYTLTLSASNGSVTSSLSQATYNAGTVVTLTPTPDTGYRFDHWTVNGTTYTTSPLNLTMDGNKSVTAHFVAVPVVNHNISTTISGNGSITPSGTVVVPDGASQSFDLAAMSGYQLSALIVDGQSVTPLPANNRYTFNNVRSNHSLSAAFSLVAPSGDLETPSIPSTVNTRAISPTKIAIAWATSTDNVGVMGYVVYRDGVARATTTATTYFESDLTADTTYSYRVRSFDAAGNRSALSSSASGKTLAKITGRFSRGSKVQTSAITTVYSEPVSTALSWRQRLLLALVTAAEAQAGQQPVGAIGVVDDDPVSAGGNTWWYVDYDSGVDGWVIDPNLKAYVAPTTDCTSNCDDDDGGGGGGGSGGGRVTTTSQVQGASTALFPPLTALFAVGHTGAHVTQLQQMLKHDGVFTGSVTGYYGPETVLAVQKFQIKYGLLSAGSPDTNGFGLSGPGTRAKLNQLYAQSGGTLSAEVQAQILALKLKLLQVLQLLYSLLQQAV